MHRLSSTPIHTLALLLSLCMPGQLAADDLQVQRLTWAGVKLVAGETTVFIDAVGTDLWAGSAPEGLVPVEADTPRRYALISHAHNDHFDVATLKRVLGERGYVICHESIATYVASRGLRVIPASLYVPVMRGGFIFTAVPAEDGLGAEQVGWIIANGEQRFFHGGDTLWHGQWNTIGQQFGPFTAAFLPINGARVAGGGPVVETAAVMDPRQALDAAVLLRAKRLVPIHYGLNDPPHYVEVPRPLHTLQEAAAGRNLDVIHLLPGEKLPD
jgi:L-ascorbate metabolism protein UlaG (beta-lactamase superfamily)